jgi:tetratricopeptide (TPR) repeat protein
MYHLSSNLVSNFFLSLFLFFVLLSSCSSDKTIDYQCNNLSQRDSLLCVLSKADTNRYDYISALNNVSDGYKDKIDSAYYYLNLMTIAANNQNSEEGIANAKRLSAILAYREGNYEKSNELNRKAINAFINLNSKEAEAKSYVLFGINHKRLGNYRASALHFKEAEKIAHQINNNQIKSLAYSNLGNTLKSVGELDSAMFYLEKGLSLKEQLGEDSASISSSLHNIALVHKESEDYALAKKYNDRAIDIRYRHGSKKNLASSITNAASISSKNGDIDAGIDSAKKALTIYEVLKNKGGLANNYGNLGELYTQKKAYKTGLEYLNKAFEIDKASGSKAYIAISYGMLGKNAFESGQQQKGIQYNQQALEIAQSIGNKVIEKDALKALQTYYSQTGEYKKAYEMQQEYIRKKDEMSNQGLKIYIQTLTELHNYNQLRDKLENTETLLIKETASNRIKLISLIIAILLIIALLWAYQIIYRNKKDLEETHQTLENSYEELDENHSEIQVLHENVNQTTKKLLKKNQQIQEQLKIEQETLSAKIKNIQQENKETQLTLKAEQSQLTENIDALQQENEKLQETIAIIQPIDKYIPVGQRRRISTSTISHVEVKRTVCHFFDVKEELSHKKITLNEVMNILPPHFVRISQSYAVNITKIKYLKGKCIVNIGNQVELEVKYLEKFEKAFYNYHP